MSETILHATTRAAWSAAQKNGEYAADSLAAQGFIHCSKVGQLLRVANLLFAGRRDMLLLVIDPALLKAVVMIVLQLLIVTALALFFSTFSSPILSAALTLGLYVVGHFNADLKHFETVVDSRPVVYLARVLYYVLPNLAPLDIKAQVVHGQPVQAGFLLLNGAYAVVYIGVLLIGATLIFLRRDFK